MRCLLRTIARNACERVNGVMRTLRTYAVVLVALGALVTAAGLFASAGARTPQQPGREAALLTHRVMVPGVASGQATFAVEAADFHWYRSAFPAASKNRVCDLSFPVPPNTLTDTGLCVRYTTIGALGVQLRSGS